ncbi:OVARIAN TUMOR DOMAIN-containing deubiquitinating enzyme 6-like isoform X1 [Lycium ferocissimum]|uniref:OVARIAN TUMOR DOMAIN-containing deubiquitinating enzyme 6-like isoform X1 n=1 Tax=Lycium ferocissimum TaxID=112874 RepID=UPI002815FDDF|nr:OVARIAN TUMOR DOMAIN-containing deubiquitinating enzyme 6-like isoform X1 [Lycium ferocissimum]XP_059314893.1 OVARIAN TUMOR DOMAIN-containing deubiquitinating enzyme 6-like isoform X1 [Lycium ferocissimum]XP_059314894.1 OVARIAN TUMOR DOMAIN-containing deubiquitinating enzyme 6-like isoform X1 [Lycium ferocissimum]XP_059314895.1 OVARIAN TUMOR DOMAIN-containing deubiquitinating enzyme 6-like isoform X1 [Lycium ferocissimum]
MTRILVQRGSTGASSSSSSNQNRSSTSLPGPSSSPAPTQQQTSSSSQVLSALKDDEFVEEIEEQVALEESSVGSSNYKGVDDESLESLGSEQSTNEEKIADNEKRDFDSEGLTKEFDGLRVVEEENEGSSVQGVTRSSCPPPPPPPVPPPKPASLNSSPRRILTGSSHASRLGSSRGTAGRSTVSTRTSPAGSRPSSPRSHCEAEGYNSDDEQNPNFGSSYDDVERERQFEMDLRRAKGLEVKRMLEDGNCLFRAVADQVYGDSENYDLVRQMCIDYMERERDHFSQFITEGFTSYCKRKRRDKVYGNNVEIQALCEMYNRPIHIYSYSAEPLNTFHGSYNTDSPPVRLSYHRGNHYNSLVDPRRLTIGAGLGFSSLQGRNVDKDQVKAAIKAQQDQQIDNALLAEGRFYSDLELTEKEIERMVMESSRAEYVANDKFRQQLGCRESSTSSAEPSSSGARSSGSDTRQESNQEVLNDCIQIMLSMGFSYARVIEAYSIFGDDVDSMVCYLIETSNSSRRKGKATE